MSPKTYLRGSEQCWRGTNFCVKVLVRSPFWNKRVKYVEVGVFREECMIMLNVLY